MNDTKLSYTDIFFCVPREGRTHEDVFVKLLSTFWSFYTFLWLFCCAFWIFCGGFHHFSLSMSYLLFLKNAIKVNETSKFNESSEIIIYVSLVKSFVQIPIVLFGLKGFGWKKPQFLIWKWLENGSKQPKDKGVKGRHPSE